MMHPNPHARKQMGDSMSPMTKTGGPNPAHAPQTGRASGKHHRVMPKGGPPTPRQRKGKRFMMPKPDKYGYY